MRLSGTMNETQLYLELNPFSILDLFSFITALVLAVLFVSRKSENQKANIFLALALFSLAFEVFDVLTQSIYPINLVFVQSTLFTIPFLFFYIYQSTNQRIKKKYYLLFLPGILHNTLFYFLEMENELTYFEYAFNIPLLVFILKQLKKHTEKLQEFYSDIENKTLRWLKLIVYVFLGFHALWILEDLVGFQYDYMFEYFAFLSSIFTFFMIFWIGHFGFSQQESFKKRLFLEKTSEGNNIKEEALSTNKEVEVFDEIRNKIIKEKVFKNPKLNLRILAGSVHLNQKELSRIINQQPGNNFYQLINQIRVDEFKRLMNSDESQKLSIIGMAQESGFNSKSTFYTAFKNLEGITPKQYEQQLNKSD